MTASRHNSSLLAPHFFLFYIFFSNKGLSKNTKCDIDYDVPERQRDETHESF